MNPWWGAARAGVRRGWIEFRNTFTNAEDLAGMVIPSVMLLTVMLLLRGATVPGTDFSLGSMAMPSVLGMSIAFSGLIGLTSTLVVEREDGTLLRAKAIPNGMVGYLVGKSVQLSGTSIVNLLIVLVPGMVLFQGLALDGAGDWLTLLGVVALGLVATMPLGAAFGSLFSNPRNIGLVTLPIMALVGISGIFYPINGFPVWLQWIAQVFPIYWLGLGMRSAMLPDALAAAEIGESWRHLETVGVLGLWTVLGLIVAPIVLRRMARRESGSSVAARREKAMQRVR